MRLQLPTCLLISVACLFAFNSQAQAQCASCDQAAAAAPSFVQDAVYTPAPTQAYAAPTAGCGCKKGCGLKKSCGCKGGCVDGCKPTGPTVAAELPTLPIRSACDSPWGLGDVPSLLTCPRSYTPPIGKAVGRPLLGRWNGF